MFQKLKKKITNQLERLHELLDNLDEARVIEPDDPNTWDSDTLYNLAEELKELQELLENKETGLLTLISDWEMEQEAEDEDYY